MVKPKPKPSTTKKRALPVAFVKHAEKLAAGKRARIEREAREAIALIKRRKAEIAEAFYDIADALLRLSDPVVLSVLGYKTVHQLADEEVDLSGKQVDELLGIRRRLTREQAIQLGSQRRAKAFIDLADATPERDTPTGLLERGAKGAGLAAHASARAAERAAAKVRREHAGPTRRGKTTTADERAIASAILKALVGARVEDARCDAVATRPGRPAKLRIEVPIGAIRQLARALAKAHG
ncbi:MAG TPA: hypothetical protein VLT33_32305 [Labilithrix sp.]|nr:hypothetical protein [Labilithrix sp.]